MHFHDIFIYYLIIFNYLLLTIEWVIELSCVRLVLINHKIINLCKLHKVQIVRRAHSVERSAYRYDICETMFISF